MLQLQNPFALLLSSLFVTFLYQCSATQFIVGDSAGWVIPPFPTYYTNWTNSHFIREGDSLGKILTNILNLGWLSFLNSFFHIFMLARNTIHIRDFNSIFHVSKNQFGFPAVGDFRYWHVGDINGHSIRIRQ